MDDPTDLQALFAFKVTSRAGVADPRIFDAFATVKREAFLGEPPWYRRTYSDEITYEADDIPDEAYDIPDGTYVDVSGETLDFVYDDEMVAIDLTRDINNGIPSLHALCLDALAIEEGQDVLHVGAGTGYYTAILAEIVGPTGRIFAFEIDPDLAKRAKENLSRWPWVDVRSVSGTSGNLPSADRIYVSAGTTHPAKAWVDSLRSGGKLLFPLQPSSEVGGMLLVQKSMDAPKWATRFIRNNHRWDARFICRARFINIQDTDQVSDRSEELKMAFENESCESVKRLYFNNEPDNKCWFKGEGWWLRR